jgi:hypothetical protein
MVERDLLTFENSSGESVEQCTKLLLVAGGEPRRNNNDCVVIIEI